MIFYRERCSLCYKICQVYKQDLNTLTGKEWLNDKVSIKYDSIKSALIPSCNNCHPSMHYIFRFTCPIIHVYTDTYGIDDHILFYTDYRCILIFDHGGSKYQIIQICIVTYPVFFTLNLQEMTVASSKNRMMVYY